MGPSTSRIRTVAHPFGNTARTTRTVSFGITASSTPRNDTNPPLNTTTGLHNPNGVVQAVVTQAPDLPTASVYGPGPDPVRPLFQRRDTKSRSIGALAHQHGQQLDYGRVHRALLADEAVELLFQAVQTPVHGTHLDSEVLDLLVQVSDLQAHRGEVGCDVRVVNLQWRAGLVAAYGVRSRIRTGRPSQRFGMVVATIAPSGRSAVGCAACWLWAAAHVSC